MRRIKSALISVFHKNGLDEIIQLLNQNGVAIYSTGGTQQFIESLSVPVRAVEDLTGYPSILGGRVKTLHPKVFGGILGRTNLVSDLAQMEQYEIPAFDLVVVDLYPFEATLADGGTHEEIVEKIDIGGISLIRAAAKNYEDVLIISSQKQYAILEQMLKHENASSNLETRKLLASKAFERSSKYDELISNYLAETNNRKALRYGENPHQKAWFDGNLEALFDQLNGKELSYNNLVDIDAAVNLIAEFDECSFAIIKHTNACGLASRPNVLEAYEAALTSDPVSAFGGILICNRNIDVATAQKINELFMEVLIAPSFDHEALDILMSKKNRILLKQKPVQLPSISRKSLLNGLVEQEIDEQICAVKDYNCVSELQPNEQELADLHFADKAAKHLKSNTISLVKNKQLIGMGCGQTSRVDALKQAINKAKAFGFETKDAAMASDAFFPFPDCVEIAAEAGISTILQPGGSIKDQLSIDVANKFGVKMVTTGMRHFKH